MICSVATSVHNTCRLREIRDSNVRGHDRCVDYELWYSLTVGGSTGRSNATVCLNRTFVSIEQRASFKPHLTSHGCHNHRRSSPPTHLRRVYRSHRPPLSAMPPATRQRAAVQPFASPSVDFAPLSSVDVETMLLAAEQSTDSAPTLRRSTRRATLLARAATAAGLPTKAAVDQPLPANTAQRSALKAATARRSVALASTLPPKSISAHHPRVAASNAATAAAASSLRSRQSVNKENVDPPTIATKQPMGLSRASKPSAEEVRRSSRLSSVPATMAASTPLALSRAGQRGKLAGTAVSKAVSVSHVVASVMSTNDAAQLQPVHIDLTVDSPAKAVPAPVACDAVPLLSAGLLPPPTTIAASSTFTTAIEKLSLTTVLGSSLPSARNVRPRPIQAVQLLSPVRAAPLSARARTHSRVPLAQRRRSASVRRESLFGEQTTIAWHANTPPTDEIRAMVRREDEKRRQRAEKEKESQRQQEAEKVSQTIAEQLQTALPAVTETRRRLRLSQSSPHIDEATVAAAVAVPAVSPIPTTEQLSATTLAPEEAATADEQQLPADAEADEEGASELCEQSSSSYSVQVLSSVTVCAALLAAIGAVLLCPLEVDAWLS